MNSPQDLVRGKLEKMRREAEERDAQRIAEKNNLRYADLSTAPINIEALALISKEMAEKAGVAAIEIKEKKVVLTVLNPENPQTKEVVKKLESSGYQPSIFVVSLSGLKHIWDFYKFVSSHQEKITGKVKIEEGKLLELKNTLTSLESVKESIVDLNNEAFSASQMLETMLAGALANKASDIHLEPAESSVKFRLRIDGLLHDIFTEIQKNVYVYLSSRIKLLSGLKLNIHNEAQDGRFTISLSDKDIEIRTSVIPSEYGETMVLRILDPDTIKLALSDLGFREDDLEITKKALEKPDGMILNTGPTGSGKTTALYTFLQHARKPEIKIITIEDPIEYHLEGISQTQVNTDAGYTFASGLRSILRQDPNIILVGEVRDLETAEIAIHSALTGHVVFSTLHTNDASGAVPRLVDMGIKPSIISSALNLIIAQRLIRRLCQNCKTAEETSPDLKNKIAGFLEKLPVRVNKESYKDVKLFKPVGCEKCNSIGYKGRIGIFELLWVSDDMRRLIAKDAIEPEIKDMAIKNGMTTLQQDGVLKTILGMSTFDEVERITGPIEW